MNDSSAIISGNLDRSMATAVRRKPDLELRSALAWAQEDGWFPTVGELDALRAAYRLALARAA